jgi:hypothetical protein
LIHTHLQWSNRYQQAGVAQAQMVVQETVLALALLHISADYLQEMDLSSVSVFCRGPLRVKERFGDHLRTITKKRVFLRRQDSAMVY